MYLKKALKYTCAGWQVSEQVQKPVPVLTFHKIDPSFEWGVTRVTPRQFRKIIHGLKSRGYTSIHLSQLCSSEYALPEKPVIITFDDAYKSVFEHAVPVLDEFNFTASIFVITGFVGKINTWDVNVGGLRFEHMNWQQIEDLHRSGFEIGSHTVHHPDLTRIGPEYIRQEVLESKHELEQHLQDRVEFISLPFGRYTRSVIDICRAAGYSGVCTYWLKSGDYGSRFIIPRRAWYLFDPWFMLDIKCSNGLPGFVEMMKLRLINFFSHGTALIKPVLKK